MTVADGRGLVPRGAWLVAAVVVAVLLVFAGSYGFHGDELYFVVTGRHLQLAAPDNPMLVPYLAAGWYALVGGGLWAFRILPALVSGAYVLLGALTAREFGAPARHQVAAAVAVAMVALTPAIGHLFETTTFDMALTAAALWLVVRALRDPGRWWPWIGAGVLTGVALETKVVAAPLLACCLVGVLVVGPRRGLAHLQPWVAAAIALVIAAPNLVWQATHGLPMAHVATTIAGGGSTSSTPRPLLLPVVLLDIGPVLSVVVVVGLVVLLRGARRGVDGWLAVGFLVFLALLLVTGGKAYYPAGFYPALLAAGAGPTLDWATARTGRRVAALALAVVSLAVTTSIGLPIYPPGSIPYRIATGPNPDLASELGWPEYVDAVGRVTAALPPASRDHSIVLTYTYAQAAALELLRPADGTALPPVFSGHNGFWYWGPPSDSATDAVVVGKFPAADLDRLYADCVVLTTITTAPGVRNALTGTPVRQCTGRRQPWSVLWPEVARTG